MTFDDAVNVWIMRWDGEIQSRIAAFFDTNMGRVNEVLKGHLWAGSEIAARQMYERSA